METFGEIYDYINAIIEALARQCNNLWQKKPIEEEAVYKLKFPLMINQIIMSTAISFVITIRVHPS